MKRKTIIYGMVGGVGPVGSAPQHPGDHISPKLKQQRDIVRDVAAFPDRREGQEPNPLKGRVKPGDPNNK